MSGRGGSRATRTEAARRQDAQRCNRDQYSRHNSSTPRDGPKFRDYDRNDQVTAIGGDARYVAVQVAGRLSRPAEPGIRGRVTSAERPGRPSTPTPPTW